jgi:hypothetical protein
MLTFFQSFLSSPPTQASAQRVWGDGFLECSLTTLWYPADWATVDADELLFLAPSLCSTGSTGRRDSGPASCIEQRFGGLIHTTVRRLGSTTPGGAAEAVSRIRESGTIDTFLSGGHASPIFDRDDAPHGAEPAPLRPDAWNVWVHDLFALACVDRMLHDAAPSSDDGALPPLLDKAGLAEALVASVHTQINAGYVYRQYAYAHELLTCGAWLGLVAAGRPAYLPPSVAEVLLTYLDRPMPAGDDAERTVADILGFYARRTGGRERLLKAARKVCASGAPRSFAPGRWPVSSSAPVASWNGALAARIGARLIRGETKQ